MKSNKMRLTALLIFLAQLACAQFEGLGSFAQDSILNRKLRNNKVASITETTTAHDRTFFSGRYCFDASGRVLETCQPYGAGFARYRYEYDKGKFPVKQIAYLQEDTAKIDYVVVNSYDEKGRRIREATVNHREGNQIEILKSETKVTEINGKTFSHTMEYWDNKVVTNIYFHDSLSGNSMFNITYRYEARDQEEGQRLHGKKELEQNRKSGRTQYQDELEYEVDGRLEVATKVKSHYYDFDAAGRNIEYGEITYDEAYMAFMQKNPSELDMYSIAPEFIRDLLAGKVKGEKKVHSRSTFDAAGRLVAKEFYGQHYTFKYDSKGLLVEESKKEFTNITTKFFYDAKGLLTKVISTATPDVSTGRQPETTVAIYAYTFY